MYKCFCSCLQGSGGSEPSGLSVFLVLWSLRTAQNRPGRAQGRSEPLGIAQSAPRAAQSRAESPRAVAQSCSRHRSKLLRARPEPLRAPQTRPERSLRAAQNRPELLEKPIGELGVTCTLHISAQCCLTWFSLLRACICPGSH